MEKYMVGDNFGNMYCEESEEFFMDKGTIYTKRIYAERKLKELSESNEYRECDFEFKIWTIILK